MAWHPHPRHRTHLQDAADDLAAGGFLYELSEIAAVGGDIRQRLFS